MNERREGSVGTIDEAWCAFAVESIAPDRSRPSVRHNRMLAAWGRVRYHALGIT
jgi:hypothetical protein